MGLVRDSPGRFRAANANVLVSEPAAGRRSALASARSSLLAIGLSLLVEAATLVRRSSPGLKWGTYFAGTGTGLTVAGLRTPVRIREDPES